MKSLFEGKGVLVLGGTGSIGREIVRSVLKHKPAVVRIFSRDAGKQMRLQEQLRRHTNVRYLLGDLRDVERLKRAMTDIDIVFHAAALKHVPMCEQNPFEAVHVNVIGTENAILAAIEKKVRRFIMISTDKATEPVNTMGASKLLAERMVTAAHYTKGRNKIILTTVRFGNVLGSDDSVVPIFKSQIRKGTPVTVTSRKMRRFVMLTEDAVALVLRAARMARGGEIFILKMPVLSIGDLAEVMAASLGPLAGRRAVQIRVTGMRPGEQHDESLLTAQEAVHTLEDDRMFIVVPSLQIAGTKRTEYRYPGAGPMRNGLYHTQGAPLLTKPKIRQLLDRAGLLKTLS